MAATAGNNMLEGIRILDLTGVVFGPYATQMLADLGADVIKVEPPAGDTMRWTAKAAVTPGMSPIFLALNRGKRSIALDLKTDAGKAALHELLAEADVFILNVRGKAAERLGLDYAAVSAIRPDIIYAHCVGFGQDGPYAELQAFDDVIQAASGVTTLLSKVDHNPAPRYLPTFLVDKVSGLYAAQAVLAAIIHRLRTGEGQHIEIAMMECFSAFLLSEHLGGNTFVPPNGPSCYFRQINPDRQPCITRDGAISIVAYTDDAWPRLFALLDAPDFLAQPRFATRKQRVEQINELYREVGRLTRNFDTAELLRRCAEAALPAQAVRSIDDMLDEPHLAATGFFRTRDHPTEGRYVEIAPPIDFSAWSPPEPCHAPHIDADHGARWRPRGTGG